MPKQPVQDNRPLFYFLVSLVVLALALAGYTGYRLYPRFDLPAAIGFGTFVLAAGAGIASFFSPCAFPLLVTLLARETGIERQAGEQTQRLPGALWGRALVFAAALSVGAALFLLLTGAAIAAGAAPFFAGITFTSSGGRAIRAGVGLLLILLGLAQLGLIRLPFGTVERATRPLIQRQARLRRENPILAFGFFGFIYLLAGFG